jgi:hypothetical protein
VAVGYVLGFAVMLVLVGWDGHPIRQGHGAAAASSHHTLPAVSNRVRPQSSARTAAIPPGT